MATLNKIVIIVNGPTEAFYTFVGSDGLPQNAAIQLPDDVSALVASAQAHVDDALTKLAPTATTPAELVAAVTRLGQLKAQAADLDAQIAAKQAALNATAAKVAP